MTDWSFDWKTWIEENQKKNFEKWKQLIRFPRWRKLIESILFSYDVFHMTNWKKLSQQKIPSAVQEEKRTGERQTEKTTDWKLSRRILAGAIFFCRSFFSRVPISQRSFRCDPAGVSWLPPLSHLATTRCKESGPDSGRLCCSPNTSPCHSRPQYQQNYVCCCNKKTLNCFLWLIWNVIFFIVSIRTRLTHS